MEDQKEDITTLQERQRDLFDTIKSLEKDIQVSAVHCHASSLTTGHHSNVDTYSNTRTTHHMYPIEAYSEVTFVVVVGGVGVVAGCILWFYIFTEAFFHSEKN